MSNIRTRIQYIFANRVLLNKLYCHNSMKKFLFVIFAALFLLPAFNAMAQVPEPKEPPKFLKGENKRIWLKLDEKEKHKPTLREKAAAAEESKNAPETGTKKKVSKKVVSPIIEGKFKVRETDYDTIWKFTTFDAKRKYLCTFPHTQLPVECNKREPEWGSFSPVMNYLQTVSRTPMRMCAVYAINPNITDSRMRNVLIERANARALECLDTFQLWCQEEQMKNKMELQVAQVDYRYWKGENYSPTQIPEQDIIPLGMVIYFGTKKIDFFPSVGADAQAFKEIKFFPNDATIVDSYNSLIDEVVKYLNENDRLEVLLTGYSDNLGTTAYNDGISRQRANEVKKILVRKGIEPYRIEVEAKGANNPVGDNNTYEGRIANNRVTITIQ